MRYLHIPLDQIADTIRDLDAAGEELVAVHLAAGMYDVFTRPRTPTRKVT